MNQYLLSVYAVESTEPAELQKPMTEAEMQASMERVNALEAEMKAAGSFVFGGRLTSAESATVVTQAAADFVMTDGPFAEAKEHIAGFYIINATDFDSALEWASKVVDCVGVPIEVRPFFSMP